MQTVPFLEKDPQPAPAARKTRTLYVREEDQEIWDQARELIGDSLSTYITNHLKTLVATKRAAQHGFERIIVKFLDSVPQAKAFYGRWIIPPDTPYETTFEGGQDYYAVALTSKGNVVIFNYWGSVYGEEEYPSGKFLVYDSFEEAARNSAMPQYLISNAMKRQGVEIEELDI
jgi:hypothetical protein